jgi:hypothetical protein
MIADIVAVCSCRGATEHVLEGENAIGRPVWRCLECGETRVGPAEPADTEGVA